MLFRSRKKAVIEGINFFEKKMEFLLDSLFMNIDSYKTIHNKNNNKLSIRIYCSRGGMRSQSVAWLLGKYNLNAITLKGGYKTYRRWILDCFSKKWNIIIIGGKTGTAEKVSSEIRGYQKDKVVANFVGLFPLQEPRFVIAAFLDEPENNLLQEPCRYASCTVVPMVKKLIERTGPLMNVIPDNQALMF